MIRYGPSVSRVVVFMRRVNRWGGFYRLKHIIRGTGFGRQSMRALAVPARAAAILTLALLSAPAAAGGDLVFVPWKILAPGDPLPSTELVLYWIPRSSDDFRHSELLTYRPLAAYARECVTLSVVRADDATTIAKLEASQKLPIAVLIGADGHVVGKVDNDRGALRAAAVDKLLRDTLRSREDALDRDLDDAPKKLGVGDRDAAVALYRRVWAHRCLFPRHGREAERALKKMGVSLVVAAR